MSTWIIGDLQGCNESFAQLRHAIAFDETRDTLVLVGDLVNRGPTSLDTLRWIVAHDHCVRTTLGNHDIHLLWCALGAGTPHKRDTILEVLQAPDAANLIDWLRAQPLALTVGDALVVHAGIHPSWTVDDALMRSATLQRRLGAPDAGEFLNRMRAGTCQRETDKADAADLDVLTRMRAIARADHALNTQYNGTVEQLPDDLVPWFCVPSPHPRPAQVFFGHWAALGFYVDLPYIALDSGCVWGNGLTAWRLEDNHHVFQPAVDRPVQQTDGERPAHQSHFEKLHA